MPRGRNGFRTESLGDDSLSSGFGRGTSQRYGRAASVDPLRGDSESEHSSAFSSSGQPRRITSKIGSLRNAGYKPGGGNVRILDTKVDFSHAQSKCNSKANLNYKPGGGDIQIVEKKLNFKENSKPRVNSLANARHTPGGGNVKIFNEKLPWLKYNKPNLPPEEKAKINKHTPLASDSPNEPIYTSRHPSTAS
uniref:Microtubule associated protein 2 n=1 Tax=Echinococcus granulosus TaxID=6210 RepID=A0A068X1Y2_ECHGR|nr:microtubule associated protein 2 [Echinococcus granulosus]